MVRKPVSAIVVGSGAMIKIAPSGYTSLGKNSEIGRRINVDRELDARGLVKLDMLEVERRLKARGGDE